MQSSCEKPSQSKQLARERAEKYYQQKTQNLKERVLSKEKAEHVLTELHKTLAALRLALQENTRAINEKNIYSTQLSADNYFAMVNESHAAIAKTMATLHTLFALGSNSSLSEFSNNSAIILQQMHDVLDNDADYMTSLRKNIFKLYGYLSLFHANAEYVLQHVNERNDTRFVYDKEVIKGVNKLKAILAELQNPTQLRMSLFDLLDQVTSKSDSQTALSVSTWYPIFGFLKSDLYNVRLVCREFNEVAKTYLGRDYDAAPHKELLFKCHGSIRCMEVLPDKNIALATNNNPAITNLLFYPNYIIDGKTGKPLIYFKHKAWFTLLKALPNGDIISAPHDENTLYLWNNKTGECKDTIALDKIISTLSFRSLKAPFLANLILVDNNTIAVSYYHELQPDDDTTVMAESDNYYFINIANHNFICEIAKAALPKELLPTKDWETHLPNNNKCTYRTVEQTDYIIMYGKDRKQRKSNPIHSQNTYRERGIIKTLPDGNLITTTKTYYPDLLGFSHATYVYLVKYPMKIAPPLQNAKNSESVEGKRLC